MLSKVSGVHSAKISADKKYILDSWSSLEVPSTTDLISASNGKVVKQLLKSVEKFPFDKVCIVLGISTASIALLGMIISVGVTFWHGSQVILL